VIEETDIFRNGGIEDITRLIVDQSKINGSDVNVIVKGKSKRKVSLKQNLIFCRSISSYNSRSILSKFKSRSYY
jgi:hypothetical protein